MIPGLNFRYLIVTSLFVGTYFRQNQWNEHISRDFNSRFDNKKWQTYSSESQNWHDLFAKAIAMTLNYNKIIQQNETENSSFNNKAGSEVVTLSYLRLQLKDICSRPH